MSRRWAWWESQRHNSRSSASDENRCHRRSVVRRSRSLRSRLRAQIWKVIYLSVSNFGHGADFRCRIGSGRRTSPPRPKLEPDQKNIAQIRAWSTAFQATFRRIRATCLLATRARPHSHGSGVQRVNQIRLSRAELDDDGGHGSAAPRPGRHKAKWLKSAEHSLEKESSRLGFGRASVVLAPVLAAGANFRRPDAIRRMASRRRNSAPRPQLKREPSNSEP